MTGTVDPFQHSPWSFWNEADAEAKARQRELLDGLRSRHPSWLLGADCFVSELASVDGELTLGDRTYVAAGAYLTGTVTAGRDCSINPYAVVRGDVRLGDGVRIGAHTSILGFNHTMDDPELEVFRQPLTSRGIRVGDDVWIGSHVVILDGITVGSKSVLAAGAVVTKDVAPGAVVGGNPARVLKWRVPQSADAEADALEAALADFGAQARSDASALLERSWDAEAGLFVDRPGAAATVRAQCDAIELADLLLGTAPPQLSADAHRERLRHWQDPATGRVGRLEPDGTLAALGAGDDDAAYHVLCVGYALDLLGDGFPPPLALITEADAATLTATLDALPWRDRAWHAGHWVDAYGTALHWTRSRGDDVPAGVAEALFGWLVTHADPSTGLWGSVTADEGLLQPINGFYRASRGTFAQFGVPVPHPGRVIDTVFAHLSDQRWSAPERQNACNVLDVAHPLWLTRSSDYRSAEIEAAARGLLDAALTRWQSGSGMSFGPGDEPGLQGTEMWLAIVWYLADILGLAGALGYRPRGVHRPDPAARPA